MRSVISHCLLLLLSPITFPVVAADGVQVETASLSELAIYPERSAPATVVSLNETGLSAEIPAKIESIRVRVGDIVAKDEILVVLDCNDYRLAETERRAHLKALEARIDLAKRRLERTRKLTEKQSVSEELLDEREADLAVLTADRSAAFAALQLASLKVGKCVVKSPFRALVIERTGSVGDYADIGKTLVRLLDIDQLEVSAQVNAGDVKQLNETSDLRFEFEGGSFEVVLRSILPSINSQTRNREVRLLFKNGPALPGAAGKLTWRDDRPHVPGNLIVNRDGQLGVFVAENRLARFVPLPAAQEGRASPVEMEPGTQLVTSGHFALRENDTLVISR